MNDASPGSPADPATLAERLPRGCFVAYEWSLRLVRGGAAVRDKSTWWVRCADENAAKSVEGVFGDMLRALKSPPEVMTRCAAAWPGVTSAGLGRARGAGGHLYLQHRPEGTARDHNEAFSWRGPDAWQTAEYRFHFHGDSIEGRGPEDLVHPALRSIWHELAADELMRSWSGFWSRRKDGIDQLCLTYPWQPALASIQSALVGFAGPAAQGLLQAYRDHHFRHLAFTTSGAHTPSVTVYFSGKARRGAGDLHEQVRRAARSVHDDIRRRVTPVLPIRPASTDKDLGAFYDTEDVAVWRHLLGPAMHYHFGLFTGGQADIDVWDDTPFETAVAELAVHVPHRASVYDLGCGWGGTALYLSRTKRCRVTGITISRTQAEYGRTLGLPVRHGDMEQTLPPGRFDVLLLLESLEHVRDKHALLRRLRAFGRKLVLRTHCQDVSAPNVVFDRSMHLVSSGQLLRLLDQTGWTVRHCVDRRAESLPTTAVWDARFASIPPQDDAHIEAFRRFSARVVQFPEAWGTAHPLLEIVAD